MKIFTFVLTFLMIGVLATAQDDVLLTNFEGDSLEGYHMNNWSEAYSPAEMANPLVAGINQSENVMFYPGHTWTHAEWGDFGGFLCGRAIDPQMWADYTYLTFKYLVFKDTLVTGDGIRIEMKYENGATSDNIEDGIAVFEQTYTGGEENVWEEVFIEFPEAVKTSDHIDFCVITKSANDRAVELYYDDFRFTLYDDPTVIEGIEKLESQNGFSVYMLENTMNIRMDHAAFVQDVQVFDMKGAMLSQQELNSTEMNFSIPVNLEAGVYMLRVKSDKETLTRKFVKL